MTDPIEPDAAARADPSQTNAGFALKAFWIFCIVVMAVGVIAMVFIKDFSLAEKLGGSYMLMVILGLMAFFAEYVDSSIGMGYGTTLTPILLIMGYSPLDIVPTVLMSQFICGIFGSGIHHSVGNVNLKVGTRANKVAIVMAICSIVGTVAAVVLALKLPQAHVKLYIGLMILAIGMFILVGNRLVGKFSWRKIVGLGTVAAFNKGISGGGYGPLVTGGQVLFGIPGKNAIGITSLAEGLVCLVGFSLYVVMTGWPNWTLVIPLVGGAIFSVPIAAFTVKILREDLLKKCIGVATIFLGALTLVKLAM